MSAGDRDGDRAAHARAALAARLRPPEGLIPGRWSESSGAPGCVEVNETFPLVFAWRRTDPAVARDLVRAALAGEQSDGVLPRRFSPDGRAADPGASWPLLAQAALSAFRADPEGGRDFALEALPALRRILSGALDLFDPGARGQPAWPSERESYLPDTWAEGLLSVDLAAFLLAEIDAAFALGLEAGAPGTDTEPKFLADARRRLAETLERDFWVAAEESFRDRLPEGGPVARETVSGFLPLLWPNLHTRIRETLLARLCREPGWMTGSGVPAWIPWPEDPRPPPVRAIDQMLLWTTLEQAGDAPAVFQRLLTAAAGRTETDPDLFELCLAAGQSKPAADPPSLSPWWNRNRTRVLVAGAAFCALALAAGIRTVSRLRGLSPASVEALSGLARNRYLAGDLDEAIRIYREVMAGARNTPPAVHAFYADALFRRGEFAEAETHYRQALEGEGLRLPMIRFNLAQTLNRQGRVAEARNLFEDLVAEADDFPEIALAAQRALNFLDEVDEELGLRPVRTDESGRTTR